MSSNAPVTISQKVTAIDTAIGLLLHGGKPRKNEVDLLVSHLTAAKRSLQWIDRNRAAVSKAMEASDES